MAKVKKIKIYTHRSRYLSAGQDAGHVAKRFFNKVAFGIFSFFYFTGLGLINFFKFLTKVALGACFHTGNLIINSIVKTFKAAKNDILTTRQTLPKRFSLIFNPQFKNALFSFFLIAGIGWGVLASLGLVARALDIKSKILRTAFVGNLYLSQAKDALSSQDLTGADSKFAMAYQAFSQGQDQINKSEQSLNALLSLVPQKTDADRLINAASLIAQAGQDFVSLEDNLKNLKLTDAGIASQGTPTAEVFQNSADLLANIKSEIYAADKNVSSVDANNLPAENREAFLELKSQLSAGDLALNNFSDIFNLAQGLLMGNKNILLLFENNNELRAGGGFMGTFGALSVTDGAITKMNVSSIYDLDGQLTENIQPPQPILNLLDHWTLRDSNWFAAWPQDAQKISEFYEKEGGETPDVVMAITPNLIVDWLKITGPVNLPKYGVTLTSDNFVEQTQVASTLSDNLPTNSPKQILADLVPILIQKISALDKSEWPQVIQSLQDNLSNKQLVIYSRDSGVENQLENLHWAGDIANTDRDYLSIVNSNLGGTKTDLYVDESVNLTTTIQSDGSLIDEVDITRTNKMPKLDQTNNLSYMRIYVPLGSKLISNLGFDYKNIDYPEGEKYEIDDDVYNWQKNSVKDVVSNTTIGQESGKTFYGNWLNVEGGDSKTVKLVYQLPFKLSDIDRYSLMLQKQIGAQDQPVHWTFNFPNYQIAWKNFDTNDLNTDNLTSDIILDKDYFLGMVMQKQ